MCGFLRACFARALRILPPPSGPALEGRVVSAAANPAAGVEHVAVHSGRLRLASKLTSRGCRPACRPPTSCSSAPWRRAGWFAHYPGGLCVTALHDVALQPIVPCHTASCPWPGSTNARASAKVTTCSSRVSGVRRQRADRVAATRRMSEPALCAAVRAIRSRATSFCTGSQIRQPVSV